MVDDMKAERDKAREELRLARVLIGTLEAERNMAWTNLSQAREELKDKEAYLALTKRHLATAVELIREYSQITNDDTTFFDKLNSALSRIGK